MSKRNNGAGTIFQRKDGRWCAQIVADDPATGERRRTSFYGKTQKEVRAKLKAAIERSEAGAPVRDAKSSVAAWLSHWRDRTLAASGRRKSTKVLYKSLSKHHLEPAPFGAIRLDRLRASDIDTLILDLHKKKLADSTIQRIFIVLRCALADAVRDGLLAHNPATSVKQPTVPKKESRFLSAPEVTSLLSAAKNSRYRPILAFIAATGLRKGEATGLRWQDVDLESGTLRVRSTLQRLEGELVLDQPKTPKSRRTLPLSPAVVALLKAQRERQAFDRRRAANQWVESGHVFTSETGRPLEPRNVLRALKTAAEKAGVDDANVHTLRHSAATAWLDNGVHLKAVSELLGHFSIAITADIYGHVTDETARNAMEGLSDAIGL